MTGMRHGRGPIDEMGWDELRAPGLCHIGHASGGAVTPAACTAWQATARSALQMDGMVMGWDEM